MRKAAETEVPIIPPILLNESNLSLIAEAVAATTTDVTITTLQAVLWSDQKQHRRVILNNYVE